MSTEQEKRRRADQILRRGAWSWLVLLVACSLLASYREFLHITAGQSQAEILIAIGYALGVTLIVALTIGSIMVLLK